MLCTYRRTVVVRTSFLRTIHDIVCSVFSLEKPLQTQFYRPLLQEIKLSFCEIYIPVLLVPTILERFCKRRGSQLLAVTNGFDPESREQD